MDCFLISLIALVDDGSLAVFGVANLTFFALVVDASRIFWPRFLKTRLGASLLACGSAFSWFLLGLGHLGDLGPASYLWLRCLHGAPPRPYLSRQKVPPFH